MEDSPASSRWPKSWRARIDLGNGGVEWRARGGVQPLPLFACIAATISSFVAIGENISPPLSPLSIFRLVGFSVLMIFCWNYAIRGRGHYFLRATRAELCWGWTHISDSDVSIRATDLTGLHIAAPIDEFEDGELKIVTRDGTTYSLPRFSKPAARLLEIERTLKLLYPGLTSPAR
jgi:hypothetical protein